MRWSIISLSQEIGIKEKPEFFYQLSWKILFSSFLLTWHTKRREPDILITTKDYTNTQSSNKTSLFPKLSWTRKIIVIFCFFHLTHRTNHCELSMWIGNFTSNKCIFLIFCMNGCPTDTYTDDPSDTAPQAMNCLLERMGGMSEYPAAAHTGLFFPDSTSPFIITSYWGPDGSTRIFKIL